MTLYLVNYNDRRYLTDMLKYNNDNNYNNSNNNNNNNYYYYYHLRIV